MFNSQYWNSSIVSGEYTCKCDAEFFSVVLIDVSYKQCAAMLCSCFLCCSSLSRESVQIFSRICSANLTSKSFTIVLMEDSYRHSNALVFAGFLYCSSLKIETLREFRKTTLANLMLKFSLWLSLMSPINNVLLCCSRASFSVSNRNHETVQIFYRICSAKLSFNSFTVVPMEVSYKRSSALVFAGSLYRSSLNIESFREFWKTTLANLMLKFSLWLSLMSPINNVLLCCSRASFSVSSRNHETVQIFYRICSAKLSFKSFTIVLMEVSYRHSAALVFACFLYRSSLNTETLREFRMTTLANVMLNFFSVVLNDVSYKQCAALLCSCFLFCSSLSVENVQIFCRICSAKLSFNSFTVIPMEVSYKRSSALVFAGFLYRSSLNIESFREFWKTTLANLMLKFSLWLSLMSPINNVLLCCSRASFSVSSRNHETVQIFYRICSAKLSFKSFTIVLMEVSYRRSAALVFAGLLYCSSLNVETLWYFKKTTLANVMLTFSLWCSMMSPINYVLLCFARASYFVQVSVMKMFKSSIEYALQNSLSIHSLLFRWKSPISAALLWFSLASYIVQVSKLKVFESFGTLHLQMWCWIFLCGSHWCLL